MVVGREPREPREPCESGESRIPNPESRHGRRRASFDPWDGATVAEAARTAEPAKRRGSAGTRHSVTAPMPATVIKVIAAPGDKVAKGDTLLVLEAMKMELPIRAPGDATVKAVCCRAGEMVAADAVLVEFEEQP